MASKKKTAKKAAPAAAPFQNQQPPAVAEDNIISPQAQQLVPAEPEPEPEQVDPRDLGLAPGHIDGVDADSELGLLPTAGSVSIESMMYRQEMEIPPIFSQVNPQYSYKWCNPQLENEWHAKFGGPFLPVNPTTHPQGCFEPFFGVDGTVRFKGFDILCFTWTDFKKATLREQAAISQRNLAAAAEPSHRVRDESGQEMAVIERVRRVASGPTETIQDAGEPADFIG